MSRAIKVIACASAVLLAISASCDSEETQTKSATGGGQGASGGSGLGGEGGHGYDCSQAEVVSTTPPDPGTPDPAPTLDCGAPTFPMATTLRRAPYLQSVTKDSARVAWTATAATAGIVRVGDSAMGPWTEVSATAETFATSRTEDSEDYVAFDATLTGLEPNRAYCYEVVVDGTVVASGLKLHTAWEGDARPVRILALGDSGNASPEQAGLRDMFMTYEHDVFLHLGDMAYGSGTYPEFEERVFDVYRDFMHAVPSFPTIGNHEYKTNRAEPYLSVYYLFEQALRDDHHERYYSFDYGNVHFVSLDSNGEMLVPIQIDIDGIADDDMIDWLEDDLAASDAEWKIAFFHHPPFSLYASRSDETGVINLILPALRNGGVDLILVGHDHHYMRSHPVRGDCPVPGGDGAIPFIIVGSGGTGLHEFEDPDDWYMAAGTDQIHAFLSFTIHGCKGDGQAVAIDGTIVDQFVINGCDN